MQPLQLCAQPMSSLLPFDSNCDMVGTAEVASSAPLCEPACRITMSRSWLSPFNDCAKLSVVGPTIGSSGWSDVGWETDFLETPPLKTPVGSTVGLSGWEDDFLETPPLKV